MPFTPAHTAIVLPFVHSRFFSATALLIGAMAPDFEYFFKMSVEGVHSHTWPGLFYFDLPVTIGLSLLYHQVVKANLILNLPAFLQRRFPEALLFNFVHGIKKRPVVFLISALIGSATHILWDGFTHGDGFFVKYFSFYDGAYVPFEGVNYPLWYALQHISTFAGLFIVSVTILLKNSSPFPETRINIWYWVTLFAIAAGTVSLRFLVYPYDYNLGNFVVSSVAGICVALIVCGLIKFPVRQV